MAQEFLDKYDFPTLVNNSRAIQFMCTVLQLVLIYTESGSLSVVAFLFYSLLVGVLAFHLFRRWYYNIDGRYDARQLIRDNEVTLKLQYAIAIFSPLILGFTIWLAIELSNGLINFLFHFATFVQLLSASIQLIFELYEVLIKK